MGRSSYPVGADLTNLFASAGLTLSDSADAEGAAAAGIAEFERRAQRIMLAGASETRLYNPPGNTGNVVRIDDVVGSVAVAYQPTTGDPTTLTAGTQYRLHDRNAVALGKPYGAVEVFSFPFSRTFDWDDWRGQLAVTGQFGYGLTIPDDAWMGMVYLGALWLVDGGILGAISAGIVTGWTESTHSEQYAKPDYAALQNGWQMKADKAVSRYTKVRF